MKKTLLIFVVLLLAAGTLFAAPFIKLNIVDVVDVGAAENGTLWVVNKAGDVYTSANAGAAFTKANITGGVARIFVSADGKNVGYVNKAGEYYFSGDSAKTFTKTTATGIVDASAGLAGGKVTSFVVSKLGELSYSADNKTFTKATGTAAGITKAVSNGAFIVLIDKTAVTYIADFKNVPALTPAKAAQAGIVDVDIDPKGVIWAVDNKGDVYSAADKGKPFVKDKVQPTGGGAVAISACAKYVFIANAKGEAHLETR